MENKTNPLKEHSWPNKGKKTMNKQAIIVEMKKETSKQCKIKLKVH